MLRIDGSPTTVLVFALTAGLGGCQKRAPQEATPLASASSSAAVVTSPVPSATQPLAATLKTNPPSASPKAEVISVSAALKRARFLQSKGKLEEADAAFEAALVVDGELDLRALAEFGYLRLTRGVMGNELELTFLTAATAGGELGAQAWYNLSLLHARSKDSEAERAALARSLRLREHAGVNNKLGRRSRCTAEVSSRVVPGLNPKVVRGWVNACQALQRCRGDQRYTAAIAKNEICVTQGADASATPEVHGCEGEGPWDSILGYMMYTFERAWISESAPDTFFVVEAMEGVWPAVCRGSVATTWSEDGIYAIADSTTTPMTSVAGQPIPQSDPENGRCLEPASSTVKSVWNRKTGRLLAAIEIPDGEAETMTLDAEGKRINISGTTCQGYVPLDGNLRFVDAKASP